MFVRNCWYVGAWSSELCEGGLLGLEIIGEPIVLFRTDGQVHALEDRCPHRHAPLSLGRLEQGHLRCMYHGLLFAPEGHCVSVPGSALVPPHCAARSYPSFERDGWIWVWMGDPSAADVLLVPTAFGVSDPKWTMRSGQIDYLANYMLVNDNLCDLSHVDFVHQQTLGLATGYGWSEAAPRVRQRDRSLRIERWLTARPASPTNPTLVDTWNGYDYHVPGVFVMESKSYLHGIAERLEFAEPNEKPMTHRVEQQAVTPIDENRTRYFFATGFDAANLPEKLIASIFETVMAAFAEDRTIIEAQQRIWDKTPHHRQKAFIPQDKAPAMFRRLINRLVEAEPAATVP